MRDAAAQRFREDLGFRGADAVAEVGEVDLIRFGRQAGIMAFVWATLLSMGFTMLVNLILMRNLRKVDMVESLKSIE